ncbi:transcriptional regulator, MarR family [Paludibacter propionicigenes WB4]|jgi:MarR family transcriptional regulator, organic hydroperoxide resistance regulator|uniref:HTH-type transcriptional regulator SarZ n=1 Tax=Paludibacter propionicigenes (strain DSM 17365 / JCM 13257 / WB4) TaxID=694427 RepID=E4T0U9_PALPW|nr:MarR family transcriptional regulator [Paludibacter propionicigenes]ADQ78224.1 transcriptional regulator, MarR family [Paludibacter propionicigenes WB4]
MNYDQLKLENQLCFPLYAASRLIIRAYQQDLDRLGITYPQYLVLMVMWEHEELTVNEIGEKLILNTNTVTPLLKRMETMGLLIRTQSKADQRKVLIKLSEQGVNMQSKAAEIPANLLSKLNIKANDAEIARALDLKNRLYDIINLVKESEQTTTELV